MNLSPQIQNIIEGFNFTGRSLGFLFIGRDGMLYESGGELERYGVGSIDKTRPVSEQAFFLEGLLPIDTDLILPCVTISEGTTVDIHILHSDEGYCVLLMDANAKENTQRLLQQSRNELSLLRSKQSKVPAAATDETTANNSIEDEIMQDSILGDLFKLLDIVIMECEDSDTFRIVGTPPEWFTALYPISKEQTEGLKPQEQFLFLDNFLIDAVDFWQNNSDNILKSGPWHESDVFKNDYYLEAIALSIKSKNILLIEFSRISYGEKHSIIQKARETSLYYNKLDKEIEKKEVLINTILHDLKGPMAGVKGYLSILNSEHLAPLNTDLISIAMQQSERVMVMIDEISEIFSSDIKGIATFHTDFELSPNIVNSTRKSVEAYYPAFSRKNVSLVMFPDIDFSREWKVVGEEVHLERVISNLLENALRYSPENSKVTIDVDDQGDHIIFIIDDEGAGVEASVSKNLFEKFSRGSYKPGEVGLGLYFCRITIERWGGVIGYAPRDEGGSRFWFRLPKPSSS